MTAGILKTCLQYILNCSPLLQLLPILGWMDTLRVEPSTRSGPASVSRFEGSSFPLFQAQWLDSSELHLYQNFLLALKSSLSLSRKQWAVIGRPGLNKIEMGWLLTFCSFLLSVPRKIDRRGKNCKAILNPTCQSNVSKKNVRCQINYIKLSRLLFSVVRKAMLSFESLQSFPKVPQGFWSCNPSTWEVNTEENDDTHWVGS